MRPYHWLFGFGLLVGGGTLWTWALAGLSEKVGTAGGITGMIALAAGCITWIEEH